MRKDGNVSRIQKAISYTAALIGATALIGVAPVSAQNPSAAPAASAAVSHPFATLETARGTIRIELYPEEAPKTVENFVTLAKNGFYNGLAFHRVVPGFVIQSGDPKRDGTGGPGYTIPDEQNKTLTHKVGAVAMAKTPAPNSAGSQFYIVITKPADRLNNKYTVFGQVVSGQDIAENIQVGDKITQVTIAEAQVAPPTIAPPITPPPATTPPPVPVPSNADAQVVERYLPDIPKSLWTAKWNRMVRVRVAIAAEGRAKPELVKKSGNDDVDRAVLSSLRQWKWKPAVQNGQSVASVAEFDLKLGTPQPK